MCKLSMRSYTSFPLCMQLFQELNITYIHLGGVHSLNFLFYYLHFCLAPESPERVPVQESEPIQTDIPQAHPTELKSSEDTLLDMWESSPLPTAAPSQAPHIMDLMGDTDSSPALPQPLLSFDDVPDATLCPSSEDMPSSLVDVTEHHMTLSYQQASDSQELDESQELLTNGDSLLKEGTQVRRSVIWL